MYFAQLFSLNTYYGIEIFCTAPFQPVDSGQYFARATVLLPVHTSAQSRSFNPSLGKAKIEPRNNFENF